MRNFFQNLYIDYLLLFRIPNLSVYQRFLFLFEKYLFLVFSMFGIKTKCSFLKRRYFPGNKFGLIWLQIMLKDYYDYYHVPIKKEYPVIFDVGANIGDYALASALFYRKATIYCFEPVKSTFELLKRNLQKYQNVKLFNVGLGEKSGESSIYVPKDEHDRASFKRSVANRGETENILITDNVRIETLNEFAEKNNIKNIDVLKIDVEGFEASVLKGAKEVIKCTSFIIIEINLRNDPRQFHDIVSLLNNYQFRLYRFGKIRINPSEKNVEVLDIVFKNLDLKTNI